MTERGDNRFSGTAHAVLQTHAVHGDIHLHAPDERKEPPRQVPLPTRCYTNNERQLDQISAAAGHGETAGDADSPASLVVVRGAPGGGKSETIYEWVAEHSADYPDGQFYVSLASGTAESGLESEALRQFLIWVGYDAATIPTTLDGRSSWFRSWSTGKRIAVVIDDALNAAQVRLLMPGPGRSVVLVTEAGPLGALRARGAASFVEIDPMSPESARVLLERILADPARSEAESEQMDELVRLCGGSTIALCVTGSLLAEFPERPVSRLVRELTRRRLAVLSKDEQLSVAGVLDTALDRLSCLAERVYQAFGQHAGEHDVSITALVAAVDADADEVHDALERLLAVRLIRETKEDRYFADALVRDHARQRCPESLASTMRARFDEFYLKHSVYAGHTLMPQRGWLELFWPDLVSTPGDQQRAREWLESERANLRAVAARQFAHGSETVCRLAVALWPLHEQGKHVDDLDEINAHAAEVAAARGDRSIQGLALVQRGFAFRHRGEYDKAVETFVRAEAVAAQHGPRDLAATVVESLGLAQRDRGHVDEAGALLSRNLETARAIGDPRRTALARMHLASVRPPNEALPLLDEAAQAFRALSRPDSRNIAKTRLWRGIKLTEAGDTSAAKESLDQAFEFMSAHKHFFDLAQVRHALGRCALVEGDKVLASYHFTEATAIYRVGGFLEHAESARHDRDAIQDVQS